MDDRQSNATGSHLVFQNEAKNVLRQDFVMMNISFKFETFTYNIIPSGGVTGKSLHTLAAAVAYSCVIHSMDWIQIFL